MSAFYVGQRVRVVRASAHEELVGTETRITGVAFGEYAAQGYDWLIRVRGETYGACSFNLEPILPEGAAPSEFTTLADLLTSLNVEVPA